MSRLWILLLVLWVSACATSNPEPPVSPSEAVHIVWPEAPEPARIEYVTRFSNAGDLGLRKSFSRKMRDLLAGDDDRRMTRPYSVAVNKNMVVVADPGLAVVHIFDTSRKTYRKLDSAGEHYFSSPIGVALDGDNLFVADSELNKVFALDNRLKLLFTIEKFKRPTSLVFDPVKQRLYVADTLAHEVRVFDKSGEYLFTIGQRGDKEAQFNYPSHLAFADERLLVNDTMNFRIQIFSPDGQHLQTFGKHGNGSGYFAQPKGVAMDSDGHIYVADALANQVQIFAPDGTFLLGFGHEGIGPGAFQMPTGIVIFDDTIYVADSHNQQVQVFRYLKEEY
jgi:DNA-binding beta-propeller fold protein YncE